MSPWTKPFSPLLISSSVLALSALSAATVFSSMALASSAVPWWAICAGTVVAKIATPAASAIAYAINLGARMGMMFSPLCELTLPDELCNGADDSIRRRFPEATQRADGLGGHGDAPVFSPMAHSLPRAHA